MQAEVLERKKPSSCMPRLESLEVAKIDPPGSEAQPAALHPWGHGPREAAECFSNCCCTSALLHGQEIAPHEAGSQKYLCTRVPKRKFKNSPLPLPPPPTSPASPLLSLPPSLKDAQFFLLALHRRVHFDLPSGRFATLPILDSSGSSGHPRGEHQFPAADVFLRLILRFNAGLGFVCVRLNE